MKRYNSPILILLFLSVLTARAIHADDSGNNNYHIDLPEFTTPPKIDGSLETPLWLQGAIIEDFTQYEPKEGNQPSEKTVAYLGYDRDNLYIAIRCFDTDPKAVRASLTQRDKVQGDDSVVVFLDTFNDKKRAFAFLVNPRGVQMDGVYTENRRHRRGRSRRGGMSGFFGFDTNWDTFFLSSATIDDEGFTVELSIPFKSLRFPNSTSQVWGLQIQRNIRRKNEEIYWHPRSRNINGFLIQAGTIQINGVLNKGRNMEVMPVVTGFMESGEKFDPEPSLNLKYGITSDLTTDLTLNPDFSQIEADMPQIDVNQRYALYFPEKRPFFLEGKDFFDTPIELVYTRTIANPIWGTKLTGKIGKTTIGFLSAYDDGPHDINIPLPENDGDEFQARRGFVNVLRVKRDLYSESHIGLLFTDKETGDAWGDITTNFNRVVGVDGHFKFKNYNRFSFQIVGSKSQVDQTRTDLVPAMNFNLSHRSRRWSLSADYSHLPEDFEASVGYIRRKDLRQITTRVGYNILPQNDIIVDIRPSLEYRRVYDFEGVLTDEEVRLGWFISGWRGSYFVGGITHELERYGGIDFKRNSFRGSISSQPFAWFSGNLSLSFGDSIYYGHDPYLGYKTSIGFRLTFRPLTNLSAYYTLSNNNFYEGRGGERVYRINLLSQRINYQLTRTFSIRLITDYNDYDKEIFNSLLLSYELRPGTVFYVGMDDLRFEEGGSWVKQGQFYFIKFSYWWRI